ncbi:hypothetical protein Y032_0232g3035 [Ancylostoma ceylanicum]|uniref:Fanconi anemia group D2 protein n=1 Tax=Ancylostoma ceylanicum TaxID=53326 RepID=A0A016SFL5_9BILA|nr:hypothetical protein Y032_0232g3035 [Ancylostoma ceylanicum]
MWSDAEDDLFDDFADPGAAAGDAQGDVGSSFSSQKSQPSQRSFAGKDLRANEFQDTQRRDRVVVNYNNDTGEAVEPSNEFEKMLLRDGIEVRSDENYKKYMYIGDTTSDLLVAKLDKNMNVRRYRDDLLSAFEEALQQRNNFVTYLEPSHSTCGVQEAIFRVLILCRSSQAKAFDLLMNQLQNLQKEGQSSLNLSHLCIAQIRFINRIYDSRPLFCSIFEREIEHWIPEIRNSLISSIPEVLTDVSVQLEAVQELQSLLLRDVKTDPTGCKLAVIAALSLLNSDAETTKKLQTRVVQSLSSFDVELLPSLIELLLRRLDNSSKNAFADLLCQFSSNLQIEKLRLSRRGKPRRTLDDIVGEVFDKLSQFVVLGGDTRWKEVNRFLRAMGPSEKGALDVASQESVIAPEADTPHTLGLFDVMLSITLLSLRTCPLNVATSIKQRFVQSQDNIECMYRLFSDALKFKQFCERNVNPIISVAQQCLWSAKPEAQKLGAKLFKELVLALPKRREVILKTMLSHAVQSETESEAVLSEFTALIDESPEAVEPYVGLVSEYFFILDRMTIDNVKRFFRAVFRLYAAKPSTVSQKDNLNVMIPLLLRSADNVQPVFGVLAALMKLETALLLEESSTREVDVQNSLKFLDEARTSASYVRICCFSGLAEVLRVCFGTKKCTAMHEWLTVFVEEFRSDFFTDCYEASSELESERYVYQDSNLWLKCSDSQNLGEAIPLLEAVMEAIRLQETWPTADTMEATQRDRWSRIFYALSANISVQGVDDNSKSSCDTLFRTIQWIRTVCPYYRKLLTTIWLFNVFSEEQTCPGVDSATLDELWTKKFLLMFECQKELAFRAKFLGQWLIPDQTPLAPITVIASEAKKKPPKKAPKRKRNAPAEEAEPAEDVLPSTQPPVISDCEKKRFVGKSVPLAKLASCMKTLKLSAVVKLMELTQGRRRASILLIDHLQNILKQVCPRIGKKSLPWAKGVASAASIHGDIGRILAEVDKMLPLLWNTFSKTVSYFRDQLNSSAVVTTETDVSDQLADLLRLCLGILEHLFSWNHVTPLPSDPDAVATRKKSRRDKLMEALEHAILQEDSERSAGSEAEKSVYEFLIDTCEVVPNVNVAVALLDCAATIRSSREELSNKLARHTLGFLKKEWVDKEGKPIKGASLTSAVKKLLSHYLNLRPVNYRLCAIQWILAKKLADLVPHDERRKSKVYDQESDDPDLNERDTKQIFACFTRATFGTIYKVLFVAMNDALASEVVLPSGNVLRRRVVQECLRTWNIAAGCVSLFGLMLRVRELRNTSLLVAAIKEGRRFLAMMCNKNSSFMYLLEDKSRLASVTEHVVEIIKSVQIGNRNFQNICVHAKANRSNILLKLVPDFRVTNEQWMRAIQAKLTGINCQDAFEIGLLKPRDINGEEIVYSADDRSSSTCSESEAEQAGEEAQSDSDDGNASEVY